MVTFLGSEIAQFYGQAVLWTTIKQKHFANYCTSKSIQLESSTVIKEV